MIVTGAGAVVEMLHRLGIRRLFGMPGIQNMALFDRLGGSGIDAVLVTDERAAAHMADAHYRVSGELGVAAVVPGPGLTNALTGLAQALLDCSAVLVIAAASNRRVKSRFQVHQIDQQRAAMPLLKEFLTVRAVEEIPELMRQGAAAAMGGAPGPVVLEIPFNFFDCPANCVFPEVKAPGAPRIAQEAVSQASALLEQGRAPGIYAGAGALDAAAELVELAEKLQAPVATTISGRGVIPENHPLAVGYGFGVSSSRLARRIFRRVDVLLAVGCRYAEAATGSYSLRVPRRHIHIDIDPTVMNANYPAQLAVCADAKDAISALLPGVRRRAPASALCSAIEQTRTAEESRILCSAPEKSCVSPARFMRHLRRAMPRDAVLCVDSGSSQLWTLTDFPVYLPRTYIVPADYQALGFAVPAGIGAKLCRPARPVVCLLGDGAFMLTGMELATARALQLALAVIVFRDGELGLVGDAQRRAYGRAFCTRLSPHFNLQLFAQSFGFDYLLVENDAAIEQSVHSVMSRTSPIILEVRVKYRHPSAYFKGAAAAAFWSAPAAVKAAVASRLALRSLVSKGK